MTAADGRSPVDVRPPQSTEDTASKTTSPSTDHSLIQYRPVEFSCTGVFVSVSGVQSPSICSIRLHYKECLVELINRCRADPAVLFSPAEMMAELQRWHVAVPTRKPEEPEPLYMHRLRMVSDIISNIIMSQPVKRVINGSDNSANHSAGSCLSPQTLTNSVPLRKQRRSPLKPNDDLCPLTSTLAPGAPLPHMLLSD